MTITNFKSDRNYVSWSMIFSQHFIAILTLYDLLRVDRDNVVGIVTRYGLVGPGIEYRRGPVKTGSGAHPASHTMGTAFSRGKTAETWSSPPTPPSAGAFVACSRVNFTFLYDLLRCVHIPGGLFRLKHVVILQ